ncbi:MAG: hypothetical protein ISR69_01900 [Gammaproteobacteria bacterium]|nr:hypothetical protein [Gammaproteobacteria bacterium]
MDTKLLFITVLILSLNSPAINAAKPLSVSLQTTLTSDDINSANKIYTGLWSNINWTEGLSRNSNYTLGLKVGTKQYSNDSTANRNEVGLNVTYRHQASSGYFSPLYSAKFSYLNSTGDNNFDLDQTYVAFYRKQPLSNQFELTLGLKYQRDSGSEERTVTSIFANTDYILSYQTIIYFGINISDEDITIVQATSPRPVAARHHSLSGNTSSATSTNNIVNSDNNSLSVGMVHQINDQHSIDLLLMRNTYKTSTNVNNDIFSIDYFYKF